MTNSLAMRANWMRYHNNNKAVLQFIADQSDLMKGFRPDSTQAIVANTLLRGLVITAFNRFESFIKDQTFLHIDSINAKEISLDLASGTVLNSFFTFQHKALGSIEKDKHIGEENRKWQRTNFLSMISRCSTKNIINISDRSFFSGSNIDSRDITEVFRFSTELIKTIGSNSLKMNFEQFLTTLGELLGIDQVSLGLGAINDLTFPKAYETLAQYRHRAAHTSNSELNIQDTSRFVKSVDCLGLILTIGFLVMEEYLENKDKDGDFILQIDLPQVNRARMGAIVEMVFYNSPSPHFFTKNLRSCDPPHGCDQRRQLIIPAVEIC